MPQISNSGSPLIKKFDATRPLYVGHGGMPSDSADSTWNRNSAQSAVLLKDPLVDPIDTVNDDPLAVEKVPHDILELLRKCIRQTLSESELEEVSVVGGVAGYTLPLGAEPTTPPLPQLKKRKKKKKT